MRRAVLRIILSVAFAFPVAAQAEYVIADSVRLPAESYVGDPVELRYTVRTAAQPVMPEQLAQPRWGTVQGLRILPGNGSFDLRLTVTPFEPGTLTLPPIDLGSLQITSLSLVVESVLAPGDTRLRAALGPQPVPGTGASLLLLGLGLSFVLAVVIYGAGPGRRHIRAVVARYRARQPYRKLLECVQMLERDITRYNMRDFYILLVSELQRFMDSRVERDCLAATSSELVGLLPELEQVCGAVPGTAGPLEEVIRSADSVKFAGRTVRRKKRDRHLMVVRAVATELESRRRKLRRPSAVREEETHVGA